MSPSFKNNRAKAAAAAKEAEAKQRQAEEGDNSTMPKSKPAEDQIDEIGDNLEKEKEQEEKQPQQPGRPGNNIHKEDKSKSKEDKDKSSSKKDEKEMDWFYCDGEEFHRQELVYLGSQKPADVANMIVELDLDPDRVLDCECTKEPAIRQDGTKVPIPVLKKQTFKEFMGGAVPELVLEDKEYKNVLINAVNSTKQRPVILSEKTLDLGDEILERLQPGFEACTASFKVRNHKPIWPWSNP